jgi:DNA primase
MDVVEVHPWGATVDDIERPDLLVFDLDPGQGIEWDFVTGTALALRDQLAGEGLPSWPKRVYLDVVRLLLTLITAGLLALFLVS